MTEHKQDPPDPKKKSPEDFEFPSLHQEEGATQQPPAISPTDLSPEASMGLGEKGRGWFIKNKTAGLFIIFAILGAGMYGISVWRAHAPKEDPAQNPVAPDVIPVNAVEVRMGRFQDEIDTVGTLKGEVEIELRFEVDGTINEFNKAEGAKIHKGEVIARLNDRDANLKVQRARIELEQTEKLFSLGGVSRTKLDESRLNLDVAQSELDKTRIVATRDGILSEKAADVGEFVTPQRKIATLVAIKNVVVKVGVIEKQVDKVFPGQKLLVSVDAYPGNIFEGTIATISPIIQGDAKTFEITAKIPNPDSLLLPGMFARTRIITYEKDDAISVSNDALVKTAGGFQIFVVNQKTGVAETRDVDVGYVSTEFSEIRSGLTPGEVVIVQKPPELKAGSKVKVIEVQKPGA